MTTSDLGWTIAHDPARRTSRVGPHLVTGGNPRRIAFRDRDVADLLAATMWLLHVDAAPVVLWHGLRDPAATFGSPNSDHKAGVAMDVNWSAHPWERTVGTAAYDRHMSTRSLRAEHEAFAQVEARMTPPGARPVVRWCGRPWTTDAGWTAYPRGYRDCMHWVIGTTDRTRIRAAAAHLRTWFRPPATEGDVRTLQRLVRVTPDGLWGPASTGAMRTLQRALGVPPTGLPGDEATRTALAHDLGLDPTATYPDLEDTMSKIDELLDEVRATKALARQTRDEVRATPKRTARAVWARTLYGFAAHWWLRRGSLGTRTDHPNYPADPGSPADVERQAAEKILGHPVPHYTGKENNA